MSEVTRQNFEETLPMLKKIIGDADIIAIDSEFTGLKSDDVSNSSLSDTIEERYENLRRTSEPFIIIQLGITAIKNWRDNKYKTTTFNFFLLPMSIPTKNRQFLCQVAAIEFLSSHSFDFNKVAYNGISYLNKIEEATLQEYFQNGTLFKSVENSMPYKDENEIKESITIVSEWLKYYSNGDENVLKIVTSSSSMQYLLQKTLRNHFPNIWTISNKEVVTIVVVSLEIRKMLEKEEKQALDRALLDSYIGFSKVFKYLVDLKKPIVGHNILLDLMYMYKLFYKPLPKRYNEFKTQIHDLFPTIYDTKFLSFQLKNKFEQDLYHFHSLGSLYSFFSEHRGNNLIPNSPKIETNYNSKVPFKTHEAGYDSYLTAYIFIKMAHIFAVKKFEKNSECNYVNNVDILKGVKEYENCIYLSHAATSYFKLDGEQKSERPQLLLVNTLVNFDMGQISKKLSPFGTCDIKSFMRGRALIAVASHESARDILKHFRNNKELYIVPYNPIKHSPSMKYLLFCSAFFSGGIMAWVYHRSISKST